MLTTQLPRTYFQFLRRAKGVQPWVLRILLLRSLPTSLICRKIDECRGNTLAAPPFLLQSATGRSRTVRNWLKRWILFSRKRFERRGIQRQYDAAEENLHQCQREKLKKTGKQWARKDEDAFAQRRFRGKERQLKRISN